MDIKIKQLIGNVHTDLFMSEVKEIAKELFNDFLLSDSAIPIISEEDKPNLLSAFECATILVVEELIKQPSKCEMIKMRDENAQLGHNESASFEDRILAIIKGKLYQSCIDSM